MSKEVPIGYSSIPSSSHGVYNSSDFFASNNGMPSPHDQLASAMQGLVCSHKNWEGLDCGATVPSGSVCHPRIKMPSEQGTSWTMILLGAAVLILLLALGYLFWRRRKKSVAHKRLV